MRTRLSISSIVVLLIALLALSFGSGAVAQDTTSMQGHPLVGTWLADTDLEDDENPLDTFVFSSDGAYIEIDANGDSSLGVWQATGATTANLTIVAGEGDDEG